MKKVIQKCISTLILSFLAVYGASEEKLMTKYILIGGFASKAADRGKAVCEEMVKGFTQPVKLLICLFARPEEGWASKFEEDKLFIAGHLPSVQLEMRMATRDDFAQQVQWADVIYLRGGDTPQLLAALRKNATWMQYLAGKTVVGTSAGACVIAQYDYDIDHFKLSENLGLLPFKVLPHYRSDYGAPHVNWDKIEQELLAYKEPLELITLREGEYRVFEQ
ncbi:hypothetical protein FJ365_04075 [Candidatus Dependentiae bacterium]|nr:hypothetical protein [Candidatus Dependentiae bacterium]